MRELEGTCVMGHIVRYDVLSMICVHIIAPFTNTNSLSLFLSPIILRERERERSGVGMYCVAFKARCVYTLSFHSRSLSLSHTYAQKSVYLWVYEGQKEREREWASNVHTDSRDDNFIRYLDFFPTHKKLKAATYEWRWADSIKTISKSVLLILPLSEAST